jgi:hypothetical protein
LQIKKLIDGKDMLIATMDSGLMLFMVYSEEVHRFIPFSEQKITHLGFSYLSNGPLLAVDPLSRAIAVAAFERDIHIYPIDKRLNFDISKQVSRLNFMGNLINFYMKLSFFLFMKDIFDCFYQHWNHLGYVLCLSSGIKNFIAIPCRSGLRVSSP